MGPVSSGEFFTRCTGEDFSLKPESSFFTATGSPEEY
jgi:hypothetical protein